MNSLLSKFFNDFISIWNANGIMRIGRALDNRRELPALSLFQIPFIPLCLLDSSINDPGILSQLHKSDSGFDIHHLIEVIGREMYFFIKIATRVSKSGGSTATVKPQPKRDFKRSSTPSISLG